MLCPRCWGSKVQPQLGLSKMLRVREPCGACGGSGSVPDVQLSPHFRLSEFLRSEAAVRRSLPNEVDALQVEQLRQLAAALELVRSVLGTLVRVTSGYRAPALNRAIGSDDGSAHPFCLAADLDAIGMSERDAALKLYRSELAYDQILVEPWLHFGLRRPRTGEQRRMGGEYLPGPAGKRVFRSFAEVA